MALAGTILLSATLLVLTTITLWLAHTSRSSAKDLADAIATILEANGKGQAQALGYTPSPNYPVPTMGDLGLDNNAGVEEGRWFPDIEFDPSMEAEGLWPRPGYISPAASDGLGAIADSLGEIDG